jgi:hypothetical protein
MKEKIKFVTRQSTQRMVIVQCALQSTFLFTVVFEFDHMRTFTCVALPKTCQGSGRAFLLLYNQIIHGSGFK